jgi:hypothetical protein
MYIGGQSQDSLGQGQAPGNGPSGDFVRQIGQIGLKLKDTLTTLSGQYPEAAEQFRVAIKSIDAGIAKVMTTNPQAGNGPPAPRTA